MLRDSFREEILAKDTGSARMFSGAGDPVLLRAQLLTGRFAIACERRRRILSDFSHTACQK
jgi:hypothetical protein